MMLTFFCCAISSDPTATFTASADQDSSEDHYQLTSGSTAVTLKPLAFSATPKPQDCFGVEPSCGPHKTAPLAPCPKASMSCRDLFLRISAVSACSCPPKCLALELHKDLSKPGRSHIARFNSLKPISKHARLPPRWLMIRCTNMKIQHTSTVHATTSYSNMPEIQ